MFDLILSDLKGRFGDKAILSPADIAPIIAKSPAVQANLRSQGRFPIPIHRGMDKSVGITIYHLAEYLANGNVEVKTKPINVRPIPEKLVKGRASARSREWLTCFQQDYAAQYEFQHQLAISIQYLWMQEDLAEKDPPTRGSVFIL